MEEYREEILKSYSLYENKYNDSVDDSLCIEVHSNGTYIVTNDDLPYGCYSIEDRYLLEKLFDEIAFVLEFTEHHNALGPYLVSVTVNGTANSLSEVKELILQYRQCNDQFLSSKVKEIIGDDGKIYLDRIKEEKR
ncbi:hypothetical protein AAK913_14350 [Enterococcus faecium]|uniref:hypothetical protein n=1 Tax=Enterococcus faecium TaxID=1352 RepID=UPI0035117269